MEAIDFMERSGCHGSSPTAASVKRLCFGALAVGHVPRTPCPEAIDFNGSLKPGGQGPRAAVARGVIMLVYNAGLLWCIIVVD